MSTDGPLRLLLYGRHECGLCNEMREAIDRLAGEFSFVVEHVDVSGDPDLEARFGQEVPVLFIEGRKAFKYRLTLPELREKLLKARAAAS